MLLSRAPGQGLYSLAEAATAALAVDKHAWRGVPLQASPLTSMHGVPLQASLLTSMQAPQGGCTRQVTRHEAHSNSSRLSCSHNNCRWHP